MSSATVALKGTRYRDVHNDALAKAIPSLHAMDFYTACEFYKRIAPTLTRPKDRALLACNDRFYLLMDILGRVDVVHPWLYYRCREVEIDPDGYLDLWAREHYKSSLITFAGVIQEVCTDPELTVCIFSHTKSIAHDFLRQIMNEFERNERLRETFSDVVWDKPRVDAPRWSLQSGLVLRRASNPKEGTVEAWGLVDGMPTGRHFGLMVYDDVVTEKTVTSPEMIKKATEAWELSDNLGAGDVRKWHVGTRYHFGDTYGIILERKILTPRLYPATDNGKLDGEPVFISKKRWEEKKRSQRTVVSAQMLQNPMAGNENVFRAEWLRQYDIRPSVMNVYIMGDPSKGRTARSDRTAIMVVGVDQNLNKFLLDGFCHRMTMSERWAALKMLHQKWMKVKGVKMVRVGWERYGQQTDDEYFKERMQSEKYAFEIIELAWPQSGGHSKRDRVERLEPDFRLGRFYLPAIVHEAGAQSLWSVDVEKSHVETRPLEKYTGQMARLVQSGQGHMVAKPIRRIDEDRKPYDVKRALIEEMLFFPFAPHDDAVDALSRIYDMDITAPSIAEDREAERLNSFSFEDV